MPDNKQPVIIDLTDIIEQKTPPPRTTEREKLSGQVKDLIKTGAGGEDHDSELDDLLAQLNDGKEGQTHTPNVDPNERLKMPGMDEMDSMLGQFASPTVRSEESTAKPAGGPAAPAAKTDAKPAAKPAAPADDLDDLLDMGGPAKPAAKDATPAAKPAAKSDDLDDLLGDLDAPAKAATPAAKPAATPAAKSDDLDLLDMPAAEPAAQAKPEAKPAPKTDELDDLLGDMDASPDLGKPAPDKTAPAAPGGKAGAMLNNLLENLDVPPSGPTDRPANAAGGDDRQLDALLDSARGSSGGQGGSAAEVEALRKEQTRLTQEIEKLQGRLAELEAGLSAPAPAPASLSPQQLGDITDQVLSAMRAEIEKSAAASAAKVIREEISALFGKS